MKPFNLEEAKAGKPVITRAGHTARVVCWDRKDKYFPILALVGEREESFYFTIDGRFYNTVESRLDLFMADEKKEGWINLYHKMTNKNERWSGNIYSSKEDAISKGGTSSNYITTIKIEWEE